jgi:hypothetical protein
MHDVVRHRGAPATSVMSRLGIAIALVVTLGLVGVNPAAAHTNLRPDATDEVLVRSCTSRPPLDYWSLEGGYPNPNGCRKCFAQGEAYEATGTYSAWCSREANGAILWLFCRVCRDGQGASVTAVDLRAAEAGSRPRLATVHATSASQASQVKVRYGSVRLSTLVFVTVGPATATAGRILDVTLTV